MSSTNGGKKPMNKRATDCIAYLTPLGTVLALIFGDRAACKVHLNQGIVVSVGFIVSYILMLKVHPPVIGQVLLLVVLAFMVLGLSYASKGEDKPLPLIGSIQILK